MPPQSGPPPARAVLIHPFVRLAVSQLPGSPKKRKIEGEDEDDDLVNYEEEEGELSDEEPEPSSASEAEDEPKGGTFDKANERFQAATGDKQAEAAGVRPGGGKM